MINLYHQDCVAWLTEYAAKIEAGEAEPFDSCCTDPPYHLVSIVKRFGKQGSAAVKVPEGGTGAYARASKGFMGKEWDGGDVAFRVETWRAVFDCLKPGAHLVAFSGTRTYHRMATAIEAAGFEVRDMLSWNFGTGFPKSHNITKALLASGLACDCPGTIVSHHHVSSENLRDLQAGLAAHDALPVDAESDMREEVLGAVDRDEASGPISESAAVIPMRDVRDANSPSAVASGADSECLLQRILPVENVCGTAAADGGQHEGAEAGTAIRGEKPGLEGRRDAQAPEGELQGRPLCASGGVGEADGTEGRLHHGASARDGADVRIPDDTDGSSQSHRPQPGEQSPEQPGNVADERGPQAWRGWPVCSGCGKPVVPEGFGTALKPAHEPICLARKPLSEKSVAANVLRWGTGAINIDGCRIEGKPKTTHKDGNKRGKPGIIYGAGKGLPEAEYPGADGRFPANLAHDGSEEVLGAFPHSESPKPHKTKRSPGLGGYDGFPNGNEEVVIGRGDSGSAARLFYTAKAGVLDRLGTSHATVKPVDIMRWLARMITPPGGHILEPFAGSGTTGIAAMAEGFACTMIELEADHVADIERKLAFLRGEGATKLQEHRRNRETKTIDDLPLFGDGE